MAANLIIALHTSMAHPNVCPNVLLGMMLLAQHPREQGYKRLSGRSLH